LETDALLVTRQVVSGSGAQRQEDFIPGMRTKSVRDVILCMNERGVKDVNECRMIDAISGPYGRNYSQGIVGGVLGEMGYTSNEVWKL
jgi:hypothetical protein